MEKIITNKIRCKLCGDCERELVVTAFSYEEAAREYRHTDKHDKAHNVKVTERLRNVIYTYTQSTN